MSYAQGSIVHAEGKAQALRPSVVTAACGETLRASQYRHVDSGALALTCPACILLVAWAQRVSNQLAGASYTGFERTTVEFHAQDPSPCS